MMITYSELERIRNKAAMDYLMAIILTVKKRVTTLGSKITSFQWVPSLNAGLWSDSYTASNTPIKRLGSEVSVKDHLTLHS
jgi:hypothetical protein